MKPLLLMALALSAGSVQGASTDRFEQVKALVGHWQGVTTKGRRVRVDYRLISRDSAVVESWQPGTPSETITVFHRDGERVLATHYCAEGNQPRLALRPGSGNNLIFEFVDATNLADRSNSHLIRLEFSPAKDGWDRSETYRAHDKDESSVLHLTRVSEEP